MPLAEIIEAREVITRASKKLLQCFLMVLGLADETCLITTGPLNGDVDDAKHLVMDVFPHEKSTDFPAAGTFQFSLQALDQPARQE